MTISKNLRAELQAAVTNGELTAATVAGLIDHTALKAEVTNSEVERLCAEAVELGCKAVCVNLGLAEAARSALPAQGPALCCVIDFPLGAGGRRSREAQAAIAADLSLDEVDIVADVGALLAGNLEMLKSDTAAVRERLSDRQVLKVILETALLDGATIAIASRAAVEGGAHFVKTSTGFHAAGGASVEAVQIMAKAVPDAGVKASGGIRTWDDAVAMITAGATRLGVSGSRGVLSGAPSA